MRGMSGMAGMMSRIISGRDEVKAGNVLLEHARFSVEHPQNLQHLQVQRACTCVLRVPRVLLGTWICVAAAACWCRGVARAQL